MLTALGVAKLLFAGPELHSHACGTETEFPHPKQVFNALRLAGGGRVLPIMCVWMVLQRLQKTCCLAY